MFFPLSTLFGQYGYVYRGINGEKRLFLTKGRLIKHMANTRREENSQLGPGPGTEDPEMTLLAFKTSEKTDRQDRLTAHNGCLCSLGW